LAGELLQLQNVLARCWIAGFAMGRPASGWLLVLQLTWLMVIGANGPAAASSDAAS